jgi:hypothetical protein
LFAAIQHPFGLYRKHPEVEVNMLLTAKVNLLSRMILGATAVMVMKQMCKQKPLKKHEKAHTPVSSSE